MWKEMGSQNLPFLLCLGSVFGSVCDSGEVIILTRLLVSLYSKLTDSCGYLILYIHHFYCFLSRSVMNSYEQHLCKLYLRNLLILCVCVYVGEWVWVCACVYMYICKLAHVCTGAYGSQKLISDISLITFYFIW